MICYEKIRAQFINKSTDDSFVIFLTGVRINAPLQLHKWLPVVCAIPSMMSELKHQPDLGMLHAEVWLGRTSLVVQYWRSMEQLLAYTRNRGSKHLPAWYTVNETIDNTGAVGIWHESYIISANSYENLYVNMPPFGLSGITPIILHSGLGA
jgi:hypothetical protein